MKSPPVSILMPARDAAATLPDCLDSILGQTLSDWELVAIDDGSSDDTAALLAAAAASDPRIRILTTTGCGLIGALNLGLQHCRADWVARMDADDIMLPQRLSRQLATAQADPGLDLVASQVQLFPEERVMAGYREYIQWQNACLSEADIADEIYWESPLAHPSVMFRRQRVVDLGAYRDGAFPEDYELWLRMHHAGCRMHKLDEVLLRWREGDGRESRTHPRYAREAFDQLRVDYLSRDPRLQTGRPIAYWGAGRMTRRRSERLVAAGFAATAWIDIDPNKIGNRLQGVPVVSPQWLAEQTDKPLVLSYVTNHGARADIAEQLAQMGYQRGHDYLMVG